MVENTKIAGSVESAESEGRAHLARRFGRWVLAGDALFREGDPSDHAFLVQSGRIHLVKRVLNEERRLGIASAGDLIGEGALVDASPRTQSALAFSDSAVLALDRASFREVLQEFPVLGARLCEQLVGRLREAEDLLDVLRLEDPRSRVVGALLQLSRGREGKVVLELSPLGLSSRVGLDVGTVKRAVQELRDRKYLRIVDEKVELPDLEALRGLYGLLGSKDELKR